MYSYYDNLQFFPYKYHWRKSLRYFVELNMIIRYQISDIYQISDKNALQMFKKVTSETNHLSLIIDMDKPLDVVTNKFLKRLKGYIHECFEKVKIVDKPNKELEELYNKRRIIRNKCNNKFSEKELEEVEKELSIKYSSTMYSKIMGEVEGLEDAEDCGFNPGKLWKLKKKLSAKACEPPIAMISSEGKLITTEEEILKEAKKHYEAVFRKRNITPGLEEIEKERERLCQERLNKAQQNKSPPWSEEDVKYVLKNLKTGKCKDPYEISNELFKPDVAGDDLVLAVTKLMNRVKEELKFPTPFNKCNITNIYKNKGKKQLFDSYRGVFRTPVLRNILDKLIYEDHY